MQIDVSPAVLAAYLALAIAPAAGAQTMADALDACEAFTANRAIPDTADLHFNPLNLVSDHDVATVETEVGTVELHFFPADEPDGRWRCHVYGLPTGWSEGPFPVTVAEGLPLADAWFTARAQAAGSQVLSFGTDRLLELCAGPGKGYIASVTTILAVDQPSGLPEADFAFFVGF